MLTYFQWEQYMEPVLKAVVCWISAKSQVLENEMAADIAAAADLGMSGRCAADIGEPEVVEAAEGYVTENSGRRDEAVA
jgi:hypothetical protein